MEEDEKEKRRRGSCFHCDGKINSGHICWNKQLHVILVRGDEDRMEEDPMDDWGPTECQFIDGLPQITPWSYGVLEQGRELFLWWASHNFLSPVLAELKIPIEASKVNFFLSWRRLVGSQGVWQRVELGLPNLKVV